MGRLCCCWFLNSSPAIVNSNKCQLVSRSSVFIGGDSLSRPIMPSMWWLDKACVRILSFGVGKKFLSVSFIELTSMVDLFDFVILSRGFVLCRLRSCRGIFLSVSFHSFRSHLFLGYLGGLWRSVLCSHSQSVVMPFSLGGQFK